MLVAEAVPVESVLKGSAAKVLLHLLRRGGVPGTNAEMMRGSGVFDRKTYYLARRQLQDYGLWGNPYGIIPQVGGITPQVGGNTPQGGGNYHPHIVAELAGEVVPAESLRERAMRADVDGDERERVEVLLAAWAELFPGDSYANRANVKKLLELGGDSAEDVLDQFESVKARNIKRPYGYIQATLQRLASVKPQVKPVEIGKPGRADEPQDYMMAEPSARSKLIRERLAKAGMLVRGEEDDD